MPELPEVETMVCALRAAGCVGCRIEKVTINWERSIAAPAATLFKSRLKNAVIAAIDRRGKWIVFQLEEQGWLLAHMRMSGCLQVARSHELVEPYIRLIFHLNGQAQIRFRDTRKFGRWRLLDNPALVLDRLGLEPLSPAFSAAWLEKGLAAKRRILKPCLLDQTFIAGLGNIYVDEALWEARLHPERISDSLTAQEVRALHRAIRTVLRRGITNLGTSLGNGWPNYVQISGEQGRNQEDLRVYKQKNEPCRRCGTAIVTIKVRQRTSHFCPRCQRKQSVAGIDVRQDPLLVGIGPIKQEVKSSNPRHLTHSVCPRPGTLSG